MAQDGNFKKIINVDNTVFKPSPQRVRNILTLNEKIAVIKAYEQRPMYKKVARMFNCSWEQIKNIIINRATIMEFYHAAKNKTTYDEIEDDLQMDLRQRKIKFLGECVYECIQRLQYHSKLSITEELIRHKALEFLDVLRIPGFFPTKKWLNLFKATYNISLSNKEISIYSEPQRSLEIKDIMTYCTKSRTIKISKYQKHEVKNIEYEAKRLRKLNFLQDALKEYLLRVTFHHKSVKLNTNSLHQVARNFNEILKVQDFEVTTHWIESFIKQHDSEACLANAKRPPLSLDLKDILSYCSRMQNKTKDNTITLTPKETALQMRVLPKQPQNIFPKTGLKFQQNTILYLDEEAGEKDIKPNIDKINVEKPNLDQPPPLKIRKIESINNDIGLQRKIPANVKMSKLPMITIRQIPQEPPKQVPKQAAAPKIYIIQKVTPNPPKENVAHLIPQPPRVEIKKETLDDNNYILPTNTPPPRIQNVHQVESSSRLSPAHRHHSPPSSSHYLSDDHEDELPRHVTSFKDVLLLLKPLEEYAMLKENYRAIGLLTQLEEVLKNEPEASTGDEEFIG